MSVMHYKAYEAIVEFDEDAGIFHGEIINLCDVITFQGTAAAEPGVSDRKTRLIITDTLKMVIF